MDKSLWKAQQMKKLSEKNLLHRIKSFLEINFDEALGEVIFLP
jgi:hypothetical protein